MDDMSTLEERRAALGAIADEIRQCEMCPLHSGRTHAVPGAGPVDADIMFIGEAPGFHEDQQGLPFVGASGKYLTQLLALIDLTREDVFITNVVKCRPPGNRDPLPNEIDLCMPAYLKRQVEIIQPKLIATLGRFSMGLFWPKNARITKIHGQPMRANNRIYYPLFHPAAVLRNPNLRPEMEQDIRRMFELVEEVHQGGSNAAADGGDHGPEDEPPQSFEQLSLF